MKKIFKLSIVLLTIVLAAGCTSDSEIAPYKPIFFVQGFEANAVGSGSTEIPIVIDGWTNVNPLGPRKWIGKTFDGNKYAEFSSFYSTAGTLNDEAWLITSKIDFTKTEKESLNFELESRFSNGAEFKVLVSTDFDGTDAGVTTATWTEVPYTVPAVDNIFVNSGILDLSAYESDSVYVAFKYIGSKPGNKTTTFQLDKIKLFENK